MKQQALAWVISGQGYKVVSVDGKQKYTADHMHIKYMQTCLPLFRLVGNLTVFCQQVLVFVSSFFCFMVI